MRRLLLYCAALRCAELYCTVYTAHRQRYIFFEFEFQSSHIRHFKKSKTVFFFFFWQTNRAHKATACSFSFSFRSSSLHQFRSLQNFIHFSLAMHCKDSPSMKCILLHSIIIVMTPDSRCNEATMYDLSTPQFRVSCLKFKRGIFGDYFSLCPQSHSCRRLSSLQWTRKRRNFFALARKTFSMQESRQRPHQHSAFSWIENDFWFDFVISWLSKFSLHHTALWLLFRLPQNLCENFIFIFGCEARRRANDDVFVLWMWNQTIRLVKEPLRF